MSTIFLFVLSKHIPTEVSPIVSLFKAANPCNHCNVKSFSGKRGVLAKYLRLMLLPVLCLLQACCNMENWRTQLKCQEWWGQNIVTAFSKNHFLVVLKGVESGKYQNHLRNLCKTYLAAPTPRDKAEEGGGDQGREVMPIRIAVLDVLTGILPYSQLIPPRTTTTRLS